MLQLTLDPSALLHLEKEKTSACQMVTSISGLSWKKGAAIPPTWNADIKLAKQFLFPWNWDLPTHLRIYWIIKEGNRYESNGFADIKIKPIDLGGYLGDSGKLISYYDRVFSTRMFSGPGTTPIIPNELEWNFAVKEKQEIEIKDDDAMVNKNTGFYNSAVAQSAQRMSPLNQALKFVFFAEDDVTATECIGFVAFPFNVTAGSRWEPLTPLPGRILSEIIDPVKNDFVQFSITYKMFGEVNMIAYCPLTLLPEKPKGQQPILLRDKNADFLGHVNLQVNDIEDQVDALLYAESKFFDLPVSFLNYLTDNKTRLLYKPPVKIDEYKKWTGQVNNFIWSVTRDALGFGNKKETDDNNFVRRIIRKYCNETIGEIQDLNEKKQYEYWTAFNAIQEALIGKNGKLFTWDLLFDLTKWKELLKELFTIEQDIRSLDAVDGQTPMKLADDVEKVIELLDLNIQLTDTETVINSKLENWLLSWKKFLDLLLSDDILVNRIVFSQWHFAWKEFNRDFINMGLDLNTLAKTKPNPDPKNRESFQKLLLWFEKVFSDTGELRLLQKEAICVKYRDEALKSFKKLTDAEIEPIAKDGISAIKLYAGERIDPNKNKDFIPFVQSDPLATPPAGTTNPPVWKEFIDSTDNAIEEIKKVVKKELEISFNIPPHLQLRVDKTNNNASLITDDLNDEIAGHIILMQRADALNSTDFTLNTWRYLNWSIVKSVLTAPPAIQEYTNKYILPAFLPENDGSKKPFLGLSNEKLSLIAGHETYTDVDPGEKVPGFFQYFFDETQKAYALWYGYNYLFAGFVALNSGVLPQAIRQTSNLWNIPNQAPDLKQHEPVADYFHLRRVPVSKIRVGTGTSTLPLPKGLLPLAFELPEWKSNGKNVVLGEQGVSLVNEQAHYLLTRPGAAVNNEFVQTEIELRFRRPTTSFWNWYAWLGKEAHTPVPSGAGISFVQKALEKELTIRDNVKDENFSGEGHLCDPAIGTDFLICLERLFPVKDKVSSTGDERQWGIIKQTDNENGLKDLESILKISGTSTTGFVRKAGSPFEITGVEIADGHVARISIHCIIKRSLFDGTTEKKFHNWMKDILDSGEVPGVKLGGQYNDYYLTKPVEIWLEGAKKPQFDPAVLWENLIRQKDGDKVLLHIKKKPDSCKELAYFSRLEVLHQVWSWNGRLDESGDLLLTGEDPDPVNGTTSNAMKWEAWAFSDRPDFSALVQETNLLALRADDGKEQMQTLFTDLRPGEEKALYYRFSVIAYSRYELLGESYKLAVESKKVVDTVDNKWRRLIRTCSRTKKLPKPSIRFVIPLTKSIKECNDGDKISSASLLVVLNDRWFSEAGLAEQLELGIALPAYENNKKEIENYIDAGNDPILSGKRLGMVNTGFHSKETYPYIENEAGNNSMAVFKPTGPIGLTFDFAAQTPRLKGCGFIVKVPGINAMIKETGEFVTDKLEPWALMQVSVRRALRKELCENNINVRPLYSEWTAKEWVQFLPSIDSFIPIEWRRLVALEGYISLTPKNNGKNISLTPNNKLPEFDSGFESYMQRFLVVTEKVVDIGGQPCEKYIGTYLYEPGTNNFTADAESPDKIIFTETEGYIRLLLIRKKGDDLKHSIWKRLFGETAIAAKPDMKTVENDPTAALPIVSERIPYKKTPDQYYVKRKNSKAYIVNL